MLLFFSLHEILWLLRSLWSMNHSLHEMLWFLRTWIIHCMKCFCFLKNVITHHMKWFGFCDPCDPWIIHRLKCFCFCEPVSFIAWNALAFANVNHSSHEMLLFLRTRIIHCMKCFGFCKRVSFIAWNAFVFANQNHSSHEMLCFCKPQSFIMWNDLAFCEHWIIHCMKCFYFCKLESFIACNDLAFANPESFIAWNAVFFRTLNHSLHVMLWLFANRESSTVQLQCGLDWYIALFRELSAHVSFSKRKSYSKISENP